MPFDRGIAAGDLYLSPAFSELLARFVYACNNRSFMLVTGDVGAGKSSALRALFAQLDASVYRFIYIADSRLTPRAFYEHALAALAIAPTGFLPRLKRNFRTTVQDLVENQERQLVVAIDEAHTLGHDMLQELRFLLNFRLDSNSLFTLLLVGQPELKATLKLLAYLPIAQRLDLTFHLGGFALPETRDYIHHQLSTAGCDQPLFTQQVIEKIHAHSKGLPRLINRLARGCLLDAALHQDRLVEDSHLARVLSDLEA